MIQQQQGCSLLVLRQLNTIDWPVMRKMPVMINALLGFVLLKPPPGYHASLVYKTFPLIVELSDPSLSSPSPVPVMDSLGGETGLLPSSFSLIPLSFHLLFSPISAFFFLSVFPSLLSLLSILNTWIWDLKNSKCHWTQTSLWMNQMTPVLSKAGFSTLCTVCFR